jgi:hypothetical protein
MLVFYLIRMRRIQIDWYDVADATKPYYPLAELCSDAYNSSVQRGEADWIMGESMLLQHNVQKLDLIKGTWPSLRCFHALFFSTNKVFEWGVLSFQFSLKACSHQIYASGLGKTNNIIFGSSCLKVRFLPKILPVSYNSNSQKGFASLSRLQSIMGTRVFRF